MKKIRKEETFEKQFCIFFRQMFFTVLQIRNVVWVKVVRLHLQHTCSLLIFFKSHQFTKILFFCSFSLLWIYLFLKWPYLILNFLQLLQELNLSTMKKTIHTTKVWKAKNYRTVSDHNKWFLFHSHLLTATKKMLPIIFLLVSFFHVYSLFMFFFFFNWMKLTLECMKWFITGFYISRS